MPKPVKKIAAEAERFIRDRLVSGADPTMSDRPEGHWPDIPLLDLSASDGLITNDALAWLNKARLPPMRIWGLSVKRSDVDGDGMSHVVDRFGRLSNVGILLFDGQPIGNRGARVLGKRGLPNLFRLHARGCQITSRGLEQLIGNGARLGGLEILDVSHNPIGSRGLEGVAQQGASSLFLKRLLMRDCDLGDDVLAQLAVDTPDRGPLFPCLRQLSLAGNRFSEERVVWFLAQDVPLVNDLRAISLSGAGQFAEIFHRLLEGPCIWKLRALRLQRTGLTKESLKPLLDVCLTVLSDLRLLDLRHNGLDDVDVEPVRSRKGVRVLV